MDFITRPILAALCLVLAALFAWKWYEASAAQKDALRAHNEALTIRNGYERLAREMEAAEREKETKRQEAARMQDHEDAINQEKSRVARAAADSAGERLLQRAGQLTASLGEACKDSTTATIGEAPSEATDLLNDLHRRGVTSIQQLAQFADDSYSAAQSCAARYESLEAGQQP